MKIAIVTTMWQRPDIFKIFGTHYKALKQKFPQLEVVVAGSESYASRELAQSFGFLYEECANKPLGRKQNKSVLRAKTINPDYIICIGSDDLISEKLLKYYIDRFEEGFDFIAPLDCYFIDKPTGKSLYWGGYRGANKGMTCGAGRALSKELLNKLAWQPWYDEVYSDVLDTGMDIKMQKITHSRHCFFLKSIKAHLIDIKSETNMTPFAKWDNTISYQTKTLLKTLPNEVQQLF